MYESSSEEEPTVVYDRLETAWEGIEVPERLEGTGKNEFEGVRYEVSIRKFDQGSEEASFVSIPSVSFRLLLPFEQRQ